MQQQVDKVLQVQRKRARSARAASRARNSPRVHRSGDENTSDELSSKLNCHTSLSLKLHIGSCCCHQHPLAQGAADARDARAAEAGRVPLRQAAVNSPPARVPHAGEKSPTAGTVERT